MGLLQHVIFNLVNNACQAMQKKGQLTIQTEFDSATQEVKFTVKDTGPGIPPEIRKKIFTPFFTTKKEGQGTGLGLSLSREILRRMGGEISFETEVGIGTEFIVKLPGVKNESSNS
jgi:two-component system NtrC family sensor kinase